MRSTRQRGFTLLELLTALFITSVVVTFAVPGYQSYRLSTERVLALRALQDAQRCLVAQRALASIVEPARCLPPDTAEYRFLFMPDGDGGNGHQWRAEPLGRQREDGCGTLVLDHLGGKSVLGASVAGTRCWRGRP
jgi:prepilin-type N-terminal cleavage/methylation domain-containing protein